MARTENRIKLHLGCTECKEQTYTTTKNRKNTPDRLSLKKYCPRCNKHTPHREEKI